MRRIDIRSKQYEGLDRLKAQAELEAARKREQLRPIPSPVIKAGNVSGAPRLPASGTAQVSQYRPNATEASLQTILTSLGLPDRPTYNWDDVAMLDLVSDRAAWQRAHEGMGWDVYIANTQYLLTTLEEDGRRRGETGAAGKARELRLLLDRAIKGGAAKKPSTREELEAAAKAAGVPEWVRSLLDKDLHFTSDTTTDQNTGNTSTTQTTDRTDQSSGDREQKTATTTTDKSSGTTTTTTTAKLTPKPKPAVPPDAAAGGAGGDAESKDADAASRAARALIPNIWKVPYWLGWSTTIAGLATVAFGSTAEMPIPEIGGLIMGLVGETLVVARACTEEALLTRTPHSLTLGAGGLAIGAAGWFSESMSLLLMGLGGMAGGVVIQTHWGYLKAWGLVQDLEKCVKDLDACAGTAEGDDRGWYCMFGLGNRWIPGCKDQPVTCLPGPLQLIQGKCRGSDPKKGTPKAGSSEQPEATRKRKRQAPQTQWR